MRLHPIIVDNREQLPAPEVTVLALKKMGVPASVSRIPYGDFRWVVEPDDIGAQWWSVVVERKTTKDLVASVQDGRLAGFIDSTGGESPPDRQIRALLLEGDVENGVRGFRGRDWSPDQLEALLFDVQLLGVVVLRSPSSQTTPTRLASFWRWSGKDSHTALLRPSLPGISDNYLDPEEKEAVRILMCLPGWGEVLAKRAIQELGCPAVVFEAILRQDYKAFANVKGIGKGLVNDAANMLRREGRK